MRLSQEECAASFAWRVKRKTGLTPEMIFDGDDRDLEDAVCVITSPHGELWFIHPSQDEGVTFFRRAVIFLRGDEILPCDLQKATSGAAHFHQKTLTHRS